MSFAAMAFKCSADGGGNAPIGNLHNESGSGQRVQRASAKWHK
eukprot:CAMPEP_0169085290 /NCGR_PEP_ID=MMETSP1015-20121227/13078_1 /TAXON_ID=342587 /ORGANISM="Karlodinium micrum, Strain CCMP2283" /LENGTH=42 /DNA_ID= /DNA_START= /DNA_END= /DNA_ORIENTATION=